MTRRLSLTLFTLLLTGSLLAQSPERGTWTAKQAENGKINLQLHDERNRSYFSQTYDAAELTGLDPAAAGAATSTDVAFHLVRDAGRFDFRGQFRDRLGHGEYTFQASRQYVQELERLGYADAGRKAMTLAALDVSLAYAREFQELNLGRSTKQLIEGRIFNVDRALVESFRTQGLTGLSLKELVQMRIFKVDAGYVQQRRAAGQSTSVKGMVESRIHNVTPEFAAEVAAAGYPELTDKQMVEFRIHRVSPAWIQELRDAGLKDVSPHDLVQMRIFGVDGDFVRRVQEAGVSSPSPTQLVQYKIHGLPRRAGML